MSFVLYKRKEKREEEEKVRKVLERKEGVFNVKRFEFRGRTVVDIGLTYGKCRLNGPRHGVSRLGVTP